MNLFLSSRRPLVLLVGALFFLVGGSLAHAQDVFKIRDIRIQGLERVEPGTVFEVLPFRQGDTYTNTLGTQAIRALFDLGSFQDVQIKKDGDVLLIEVQERSIFGQVIFEGFKEIGKDSLAKSLKEVGIAEGKPYNKAVVDRAEQEIRRLYAARGFYNSNLLTTVTPVARGRVNIVLKMTEDVVSTIRSIRVEGNKAFSTSTLLGLMGLTESGWMTWYTKSNRYTEAKLNADLEEIRSYYTRRGYFDFKITSSEVNISRDKRDIDIAITVSEGRLFRLGSVTLAGNYLGREADFKNKLLLKPGQEFSSLNLSESVKAVTEQFGNMGYAFAKVETQTQAKRDQGFVDVFISANPGERAYIRNILIKGNRVTRDEVIRREMRQLESSWYSGDKVRLSRDRINRLGFFSDVSFDLKEIADKPDMADLEIKVTEKPNGTLSLTAGYASDEKLSLGAGIRQDNVFGTGQALDFQVNTSKNSRTFVLSSTDPYFTNDGVSRTFDAGYRTSTPSNTQGGDYKLITRNMGLRFGVPYSEVDRVYYGFIPENTIIEKGNNLPYSYAQYISKFGESSYAYPLSVFWARDERDSVITPAHGKYVRAGLEASPAGDARYWRADLGYQQYFDVTKAITWAFNIELGWGNGVGSRPYPVFKNYNVGGIGSVRGFEGGTLGPVDASGSYVGGAKKIQFNQEMYFPIPGFGNDKSVRTFLFLDAGSAFASDEKISSDKIRASAGLGLSWLSPIGPLKFSYAFPVRKLINDKVQKFQFQIGTAF